MSRLLLPWDYADKEANSGPAQINRQKSANNIEPVHVDPEAKTGIFLDNDGKQIVTELDTCPCRDFNYSGNSPRKRFAPCKHMYRLAMELKLFVNEQLDHRGLMKSMNTEERKQHEVERLNAIPRDETQWGGWAAMVHNSANQMDRQFRAYELSEQKDSVEDMTPECARVNGYGTTLRSCTCADFEERQLPCKHIYCLALAKGIPLHMDRQKFNKERERFNDSFVPLITITADTSRPEAPVIAVQLADEEPNKPVTDEEIYSINDGVQHSQERSLQVLDEIARYEPMLCAKKKPTDPDKYTWRRSKRILTSFPRGFAETWAFKIHGAFAHTLGIERKTLSETEIRDGIKPYYNQGYAFSFAKGQIIYDNADGYTLKWSEAVKKIKRAVRIEFGVPDELDQRTGSKIHGFVIANLLRVVDGKLESERTIQLTQSVLVQCLITGEFPE